MAQTNPNMGGSSDNVLPVYQPGTIITVEIQEEIVEVEPEPQPSTSYQAAQLVCTDHHICFLCGKPFVAHQIFEAHPFYIPYIKFGEDQGIDEDF